VDNGLRQSSALRELEIFDRLARQDPANAEWQTDVAVSCWKLSRLRGQGVTDREVADLLKRGLEIAERLAREGRLTANQQGWARAFRDEWAKR
jgi:hypothetical protein